MIQRWGEGALELWGFRFLVGIGLCLVGKKRLRAFKGVPRRSLEGRSYAELRGVCDPLVCLSLCDGNTI